MLIRFGESFSMDSPRVRILVASPLARVIAGPLAAAMPHATVVPAVDPLTVHREIKRAVRFDVVTTDLIWNRPELEYRFDGFDVLETLRRAERAAPVLFTAQGHSVERDHFEEAIHRSDVAGVIEKVSGFEALLNAVQATAYGRRPAEPVRPAGPPPLYTLFSGRRGRTAGRLAGAIAAGRASDGASLAKAAGVAPNTANKVAGRYLGPIIEQRREHDPELPMTLATVYRWCGVHARYLVSWCRRNGYPEVVGAI